MVTTHELSIYPKRDRKTIERMVIKGVLLPIRVGRNFRFIRSEVIERLSRARVGTPQKTPAARIRQRQRSRDPFPPSIRPTNPPGPNTPVFPRLHDIRLPTKLIPLFRRLREPLRRAT